MDFRINYDLKFRSIKKGVLIWTETLTSYMFMETNNKKNQILLL